ncbi:MAG: AAA family ATPase, partial [Candidatus Eisenbacteria bacterium]|nr:AAA family ATPase [Candidatus Eisenbacteria bacterium]
LERLQGRSAHALGSLLRSEQAVGRAGEWVRLERWLGPEEAHRLLMVEGGPGSGKSTLLRALAARATLAGHPVIAIAATAGAGSGELGRRLLLRLAAAAEANGQLTSEISAVRERLEQGALRADEDLMALAEFGLRWAAGSAGSRPLVVLLDDIDHGDARSLAIVRRMSSSAPPQTRWLWASGAGWVTEGSPEALLAQAGWAERMPLGPLTAEESHALIEARLRATPPRALSDFIWERCGGHPGMTVEALHRLAASNVIALTEAGVQFDRTALSSVVFPADFLTACLERLRQRDGQTIRAAHVLAVWDAPLDLADLARLGVEQAERVASGLQMAGLLGRDDDGHVSLNPPALRRVLREALSPDERAAIGRAALELPGVSTEQRFRLQGAIGEPERALEEAELAFAERADIALAEAAAQIAAQAGLVAREAAWHGRAGRLLYARGRLRDAVGHFKAALELGAEDPGHERWIMELSQSLLRLGRHDEVREFNQTMLARPIGPLCRVHLLITSTGMHVDRGEVSTAVAALNEAHQLAEQLGDPEALGLVGLARAFRRMRENRDGGDAIELARVALAHFQSIGDVRQELRVVCALCSAQWQAQRGQEGLPLLNEGIERARALDLRIPLIEMLAVRIQVLVHSGDWRAAVPVQEEYVRLSIEEGLQFYTTTGVIWFSLLLALIGEHDAGRRLAWRGIGLARTYLPGLLSTAYRALALAARNGGRARLVAGAHARSIRHREKSMDPTCYPWLRLEFGQLLAWRGRWQRALEVWDAVLRDQPDPDVLEYVILNLQSARACLRIEALRGEAKRRREQVEDWCHRQAQPLALAHRAQFDAEAHLLEGRVEATIESARECLEAFDRFPAPAESAHAALAIARLGLESPIAPRLPIAEWLEHALAGFHRLGDRASRVDALERMYDLQRRFGGVRRKPLRDRELLTRVGQLIESMSDFEQLSRAAIQLAVDELDAERGVLLLAPRDSDDEAEL